MKIRGDVESVNLSTGERFVRVVGDGESRLESLGTPLTPAQIDVLKAFEKAMVEETIPEIEREMRRRARAAQWSRKQLIF